MPVLTAAITALGLSGTPGLPGGPYDHTSPPALRTYSGDFTRLTTGTPGRLYGSFAGKASSVTEYKTANVSLIPRLTVGDTAQSDIDVTAKILPVVTVTANAQLGKTVNAALVPVITPLVLNLSKSGTQAVTGTASIVPVVRATAGVSISLPVTASLIPVITATAAVEASNNNLVSVSLIPVVRAQYLVQQYLASVSFPRTALLVPRVTVSTGLRIVGEVDRIDISSRPMGRITIRET